MSCSIYTDKDPFFLSKSQFIQMLWVYLSISFHHLNTALKPESSEHCSHRNKAKWKFPDSNEYFNQHKALIMSYPKPSEKICGPQGLSFKEKVRMLGLLFGESTCQSWLKQQESIWPTQSGEVPAQQVRDQEEESHLERGWTLKGPHVLQLTHDRYTKT